MKLLCDPESRKTRVEIFLSLRLRMTLTVGVADGGKETGEAVLIEITLVGACMTVGLKQLVELMREPGAQRLHCSYCCY